MNRRDAQEEIARLTREIRHHDVLYYQHAAPVITDAQYDEKRRRLEALEQQFPDLKQLDSPTQTVGAPASETFAKVTHSVPMLSLNNAFSDEDMAEFEARIRRFLNLSASETIAYVCEPKIDGLSFSARY
ncbi:MAG: NAD-dependent DNA ligase LigA, partial [Alphaproteobacteria bacterium]|nr:NAD-dependent DNA ligase LigA [Alphaproteobacteria bacterium]